MNFAENLLHYASQQGKKTALITAGKTIHPLFGRLIVCVCAGEGQTPQRISFSQLREGVAAIASALSELGVAKGDVVAGQNRS